MSQDSNLGVYILVGLLITVLVLAIPVIAADRTVFDTGHATDTIEDEDVYSRTTVAFQDRIADLVDEALPQNSSQQSPPLLDDEQRRQIAETAVTESYVEAELSGHIDTAYSYLHGNRDDARFVFNLSEPKARAIEEATALEREARAERNPRITDPDAVPSDRLMIAPSLSSEIPDSQNITDAGAVPGELDTARTVSAVVGILWWFLPVLAFVLVGVIYYVAGSVRKTAEATGGALVAAGLLSCIVGLGGRPIARSVTQGRVALENPAFDSLSDGLVSLVGSLFDLILIQSGLVFVSGILVLGVVSAEANGVFDSFTNRDETAAGRDQSTDRDAASGDSHDDSESAQRYSDDRQRASDTGGPQTDTESAAGTARSVDTETEPTAESQHETDQGTRESADTDGAYDPDQYDEHGFKVDEPTDEDNP